MPSLHHLSCSPGSGGRVLLKMHLPRPWSFFHRYHEPPPAARDRRPRGTRRRRRRCRSGQVHHVPIGHQCSSGGAAQRPGFEHASRRFLRHVLRSCCGRRQHHQVHHHPAVVCQGIPQRGRGRGRIIRGINEGEGEGELVASKDYRGGKTAHLVARSFVAAYGIYFCPTAPNSLIPCICLFGLHLNGCICNLKTTDSQGKGRALHSRTSRSDGGNGPVAVYRN